MRSDMRSQEKEDRTYMTVYTYLNGQWSSQEVLRNESLPERAKIRIMSPEEADELMRVNSKK